MDFILDYNLVVPSNNTPRIQECHMTIYHTICEEMENKMFIK
jgi:D-sedoheptulose 7-phosphate isomerase